MFNSIKLIVITNII